jgi:hypothetical protein
MALSTMDDSRVRAMVARQASLKDSWGKHSLRWEIASTLIGTGGLNGLSVAQIMADTEKVLDWLSAELKKEIDAA